MVPLGKGRSRSPRRATSWSSPCAWSSTPATRTPPAYPATWSTRPPTSTPPTTRPPTSSMASSSSRAPAAAAPEPGHQGLPALRRDGPAGGPPTRRGTGTGHPGVARPSLGRAGGGLLRSQLGPSIAARRTCVRALLRQWGYEPYPATADKLRSLGASLHAGVYRSAASIISYRHVLICL